MMIIFLRELQDAVKSLRFITLLVVGLILFIISGLMFSSRYVDTRKEYDQRISVIHSVKSTRTAVALRKPSQFLFLAEGGDRYRIQEYRISPGGKIEPSPYSSPQGNPAMPVTPELDWAFIIKIVFSLYALLLGYAAISGEREQGTLRMMLSNSHSRPKILTAKYLTILAVLFIPLFAGITAGLGVIGGSTPEARSLASLARYIILLFTITAYLSVFIFMSLLVSSFVRESSVSLLVLLVLWMICIIIPDISGILSENIYKGQREYALSKALIASERYEVYRNLKTSFQERIDTGQLKTLEEVKKSYAAEVGVINRSISLNREAITNYFQRKAQIAHMISRISPMALFQYVVEATAGTGDIQERRLMEEMKRFSWEYDRYIKEKLGIVVPEFEFGEVNLLINVKVATIKLPQPEEYGGDNSGMPLFRESNPSLSQILRGLFPDLSGLLLWNIVLAMGAFLAFNSADVR